MDIFEDIGGCALFAVIAAVVLLLIACVAFILLGAAIPDIIGS